MAKTNFITGIDIGNSTIKTVIAEFKPNYQRPQIIGIGISQSNGLRRGLVVDLEEATKDLKESIVQAESSSGVKIKNAYVSISGSHIRTQLSKGVIAVSRADNEVSENDIQRVIEAASAVSLPQNREILHIIPKRFIVDGQEYVNKPLGIKGIRLEAEVLIIDALTPYIKNLAKVVNENDVEVNEFVYAPLAAAKAVLDKKAKEHGVLCLDFGGGLCNLAIFEEGELLHVWSLPIGSKNITNDLAIAIKTSLDNAEKIKLSYGFLGTSPGKKEMFNLSELIGEENFFIPKKLIGDVINDRVSEIVEMISIELKKINRFNLLPGGIILIGGGSNLPGFQNFIKEKLKLPTKKINNYDLDGITNIMEDPSFAVAVGLIFWGREKENKGGKPEFLRNYPSKKILDKIKDWLKNFIP